jgi:hypothetical protein
MLTLAVERDCCDHSENERDGNFFGVMTGDPNAGSKSVKRERASVSEIHACELAKCRATDKRSVDGSNGVLESAASL